MLPSSLTPLYQKYSVYGSSRAMLRAFPPAPRRTRKGDKHIGVGVPKTMGFLSPSLVRRGAGGNARMFLEAFCHQRPKNTLAQRGGRDRV